MKPTFSLLLALLFLAPAALANDDPYCMVVRHYDNTNQRWNRNTNVRVWVAPSVHPGLAQPMVEAVHTWANHPNNSSGVIFTIVDAEPVDGGNTLIFRQDALGNLPAQYSMDPSSKRATIVLNSGITNATAALQTALHEVGHTYGLLDCYECGPGTSVMNERPTNNLNDMSWPLSPSDCDVVGAMQAMGGQKKVETSQVPYQPADNEPVCYDQYMIASICWVTDGGDVCKIYVSEKIGEYCE